MKDDKTASQETGQPLVDVQLSDEERRARARRRTLLKAGWALPVITMVPLPRESAMAQTGAHGDAHGDTHTDTHTDSD